MTWWIIAAAGAVAGVCLYGWALCRAAALADRRPPVRPLHDLGDLARAA